MRSFQFSALPPVFRKRKVRGIVVPGRPEGVPVTCAWKAGTGPVDTEEEEEAQFAWRVPARAGPVWVWPAALKYWTV